MAAVVSIPRSVVPACDVPKNKYEMILQATQNVKKVEAVKVGCVLMLEEGLPKMELEQGTLYNHGCGSTDIPDMQKNIMSVLAKKSEIEGVVLTPTSGPATLRASIKAARENKLKVWIEPTADNMREYQKPTGFLDPAALNEIVAIGVNERVTGVILPEGTMTTTSFDVTTFTKEIELRHRTMSGKIVYQSGTEAPELRGYDVVREGLPGLVDIAHEYGKQVIYDHQKAGMNNPREAGRFAEACREGRVDAAILFLQASVQSSMAHIKALKDRGVEPIVGAQMTHPAYLRSEKSDIGEPGFIQDDAVLKAYRLAVSGVAEVFENKSYIIDNLVVPGNKLDAVVRIRKAVEEYCPDAAAYSPGMITQQGDPGEAAKAWGDRFHAIVGRDITKHETVEAMREATVKLTSKI